MQYNSCCGRDFQFSSIGGSSVVYPIPKGSGGLWLVTTKVEPTAYGVAVTCSMLMFLASASLDLALSPRGGKEPASSEAVDVQEAWSRMQSPACASQGD